MVVRLYGTGSNSITSGVEFNQNGSSTATGIEDAPQAAAGTSGTATATTPSDNWVADTVALKGKPGDTSITVTRPANRAAGDFLLVAVTAQDLGAGNICAPNDGTWALVSKDRQPGSGSSITHTVFRSFRSGAGAETYQFNFRSGSCPAGGSPVSAGATAVAVRYTGVDTTTPIDASTRGVGNGTTPTAPAVTTTVANDRVVRLYGTGATSISAGVTHSQGGATTATGVFDATQAIPGATGPATATTPSADWIANTIALRDSRNSISVNRPANMADGDFLLVSVTAEGLDTGNICAPNDGTWTLVRQDKQGAGASSVTQATFRSVRAGAAAETYVFTFRTGACPTGGSPASVSASAVVVRYTNVDPTTPIDVSAGGITPTNPGTTLTAPSATATVGNDQVVRFYGTGSTTLTPATVTFNQSGTSTATGVEDALQAGTGSTGTATATSGTNDNWVGQTIALTLRTSIVVGRPVDQSDADFMLVSVTAKDLNGGCIWPKDYTEWTQIRQDRQPAAGSSITHATFWSIRGAVGDELYQFDFRTGACPAAGSPSSGSPVAISASAVAVRYTGVNLLFPIDIQARPRCGLQPQHYPHGACGHDHGRQRPGRPFLRHRQHVHE